MTRRIVTDQLDLAVPMLIVWRRIAYAFQIGLTIVAF